jgi:transposase
LWVYAFFLISSTRCGISTKQLERKLGIAYMTAWRMFNLIRKLMGEDAAPISGEVEIDETYRGDKRKGDKRGRPGKDSHKKPIVRLAQRGENGGSKIATLATTDTTRATVESIVTEHVLADSLVYTDEYIVYDNLDAIGYQHKHVVHSAKGYAVGNIHLNTLQALALGWNRDYTSAPECVFAIRGRKDYGDDDERHVRPLPS